MFDRKRKEEITGIFNGISPDRTLQDGNEMQKVCAVLTKEFFDELNSFAYSNDEVDSALTEAFKKVLKKYPGEVHQKYIEHSGIPQVTRPPFFYNYFHGVATAIISDIEINELKNLKIDSFFRGREIKEEKKNEEDKKEQTVSTKKIKYPHRVADIAEIIQGTFSIGSREPDYDPKENANPRDNFEKVMSIFRKSTEALNHGKSFRSDATTQFYNKTIDNLANVDDEILSSIGDEIVKYRDNNLFKLGFWGGGVRLGEYKINNVPHRIRDIHIQIKIAANPLTANEKRTLAIREIVKLSSEAIARGKGSQTVSTRQFYENILRCLAEKKPMCARNYY